MNEKQEKNILKSGKLEKVCYALGGVGANIINGFITAYVTLYYTDSVGISAAFAGTMMLFCRLFDGISDIAMGVIIDKTRSRFGKARAWILYSSIPLVLSFIAMFCIPAGLSGTLKMAWAAITYFLVTVIFFTANNLAYHTLLLRFSLDSADRNATTAIRSIFAMITMMGMNMATPILLPMLGGASKQGAWTTMVLAYAVLSTISLFVTFFGTTEKVSALDDSSKTQETVPMKEAVKLILSTKYFYITILLFLAYYILNGTAGIGIYYARDVLGNMSLQSIVSMLGLLPTFIFAPMMPKFIRKFGKKHTIMAGLSISCLGCIITLFAPRNVAVYIVGCILKSLGGVPMAVALFTLIGDVVDFLDMKHGVRTEGVAMAANNVGQKLGTGLGSALLGWMLAWGNYVGNAPVQPDSAITAIIATTVVIPLIINVIAFVLFLFWDIEKYGPEVTAYMQGKVAGKTTK